MFESIGQIPVEAAKNVAMTALMHQRSENDTVVTALPCPHVYGNVVMSGAIQTGMTLVLHPLIELWEMTEIGGLGTTLSRSAASTLRLTRCPGLCSSLTICPRPAPAK
jgi:hypothetical protein